MPMPKRRQFSSNRRDTRAAQDVTHCLVADVVAQFEQLTLNASIAPPILTSQTQHQLLNFAVCPRRTRAAVSASPFAPHQLPVPPKQRRWFHDRDHLTHRIEGASRLGFLLSSNNTSVESACHPQTQTILHLDRADSLPHLWMAGITCASEGHIECRPPPPASSGSRAAHPTRQKKAARSIQSSSHKTR